jgi:Domain of unknown function (DUF4397)
MKQVIFGGATLVLALAACNMTPAQKVQLRVAHLSPDAPAVDVCLKASSKADFTGVAPTLKGLGATTGLAFGQVTKALEVDAGSYDIRIVAPNAADCGTSLAGLPDFNGNTLTAGSSVTVGAIGFVTKPEGNTNGFTLKAFANDAAKPEATKTKLRIVHTSPDTPAVDAGLLAGDVFTPLATNFAYPNAWNAAGANAQGYATVDKLSSATLAVRATGQTAIALTIPGVTTNGADIFTGWAIGQLAGTGEKRLSVLLCEESKTLAASDLLTSCARVPVLE